MSAPFALQLNEALLTPQLQLRLQHLTSRVSACQPSHMATHTRNTPKNAYTHIYTHPMHAQDA